MTRLPNLLRQRGFTLVEAVAVIVVTAVVATMMTSFINVPVNTYLDNVKRAEESDMADHAMRRLSRDLRLALPNSVRVSGNSIEYLETKVGLRYLAEDDVDTPGGGSYLNWNDAAQRTFTVVGGVPPGRNAPVVGDSVVVYNLGSGQEPGDAYNCLGACNRAQIQSLTATTITMVSNVFAAQTTLGVPLMSPAKRFHVVSTPVTWRCDTATGRLNRHWGYAITAGQNPIPTGGSTALLAENVFSCAFKYETSLSSQHSALIGITLGVRPKGGSQTINLVHQVHLDNTP
ncbi:MAG TPA: prepilin-type N-terminal cleavage/methylation domain-containing protein [Telluria sp.]|jgi:MSHA biogenesis protein MshO